MFSREIHFPVNLIPFSLKSAQASMLEWFTGMKVSVLLYRTRIWDGLFLLPFIAAFIAGFSQGLDLQQCWFFFSLLVVLLLPCRV